MAYYNTCPRCGCHLDPGERCDCTKEEKTSPASQWAEAETARIAPSERAYYGPSRAWVGKPGPKTAPQ